MRLSLQLVMSVGLLALYSAETTKLRKHGCGPVPTMQITADAPGANHGMVVEPVTHVRSVCTGFPVKNKYCVAKSKSSTEYRIKEQTWMGQHVERRLHVTNDMTCLYQCPTEAEAGCIAYNERNENIKYINNDDKCKCLCKEKKNCDPMGNGEFTWSEKICNCECAKRKICTSTSYFNEETCVCVQNP